MKIRHEIDILRHYQGPTGAGNETIYFDNSKYSGSLSFTFECLAYTDDPFSGTVQLKNSAGTTVATITIPANITTYTFYSTTIASLPTDSYYLYVVNYTEWVRAARIIIVEDTGEDELTDTEVQIPIGTHGSTTSEVAVEGSYPIYWKYTSANWVATTKNFYVEAVYASGNSMSDVTVELQYSTNQTSWSADTTVLTGAALTTVPGTRVRVSFTPVDGRYYRLVFYTENDMYSAMLYGGAIIVDLSDPTAITALEEHMHNSTVPETSTGDKRSHAYYDEDDFDGVTAAPYPEMQGSSSSSSIKLKDTSGDISNSTVTGQYLNRGGTQLSLTDDDYIYSNVIVA